MTTSRMCISVLVLQEPKELRESVVRFLRAQGFHVVGTATCDQAMLALASVPRPVLLLADLMMPGADGPALLTVLGEDDRLATLPVVLVSVESSSQRAAGHVKNIIDFRDLLAIVEGLCVRRG